MQKVPPPEAGRGPASPTLSKILTARSPFAVPGKRSRPTPASRDAPKFYLPEDAPPAFAQTLNTQSRNKMQIQIPTLPADPKKAAETVAVKFYWSDPDLSYRDRDFSLKGE